MKDVAVFDRRRIRRRFGRAADEYADRARLQAEVAGRLLERLDGLRFEPTTVVDLGCGPGLQARALTERFGKAQVLAMDLALPMLVRARRQAGWRGRRFARVAGDAHALPLARSSVDLIYSNLMLQWSDDLPAVLNGLRRVLKPGGLLLISTFGPDTLSELRQAWAAVDDAEHVSRFTDVQTVGDCLVRAGFSEPVLDTDWITTTYSQPRGLLDELRAIGATDAMRRPGAGLTTPARLRGMLAAYETHRRPDGLVPATWEVVYASAWAPDPGTPIRSIHGGEEASVPIEAIGRRRRDPESSR
ncbi:malonyl-ACP O-methyltransferase BioC [Wenzhouxiangella sp. XN79A]|uniref:malonyl-ACP O-methyltransferase BioC n=1 Tax=Wenzhouxiangella sp. XN79A TaxID=2724193 RepID=UPI00144A56BF|nr:malonyl-ACP O-methyltransferase BioC [Wenzhouxiangella sp. XN79A]NKI35267.1 malonyl-ACP O-methyltransferase BioC [Wenzhouxiangella sp. XN79A]